MSFVFDEFKLSLCFSFPRLQINSGDCLTQIQTNLIVPEANLRLLSYSTTCLLSLPHYHNPKSQVHPRVQQTKRGCYRYLNYLHAALSCLTNLLF